MFLTWTCFGVRFPTGCTIARIPPSGTRLGSAASTTGSSNWWVTWTRITRNYIREWTGFRVWLKKTIWAVRLPCTLCYVCTLYLDSCYLRRVICVLQLRDNLEYRSGCRTRKATALLYVARKWRSRIMIRILKQEVNMNSHDATVDMSTVDMSTVDMSTVDMATVDNGRHCWDSQ